MIPYGRQSVEPDDIAAVVEVLRGDWLTQGPAIEHFEAELAENVGARYGVAFSSGTAALHGAAYAAGLGPGAVAYTSPLTFMASANCARYVGANPGLIDIDDTSMNLDLSLIPRHADAVIPVHYGGLPVDLGDPVFVQNRPKVVIEDAAHALGAKTPQGPVGNCANSDMTCFSFHPVKPITAGEGGMVTTNDQGLADRLRKFRSHGIVRRPDVDDWYYEISELGYHYRMTDIQAALASSQLQKLERFIVRRNEIAQRYRSELSRIEKIRFQSLPKEGFLHGYHLFPIRVKERRELFSFLRESGIGVQVHYVPVHHHPISRDIELPAEGLPNADQAYEQLISLPIHPGLTDSEQTFVVSQIESFYREL